MHNQRSPVETRRADGLPRLPRPGDAVYGIEDAARSMIPVSKMCPGANGDAASRASTHNFLLTLVAENLAEFSVQAHRFLRGLIHHFHPAPSVCGQLSLGHQVGGLNDRLQ